MYLLPQLARRRQKLDCFLPDWEMPAIIQARCIPRYYDASETHRSLSKTYLSFRAESQNRKHNTGRHSFPSPLLPRQHDRPEPAAPAEAGTARAI